MSGRRHTSCSTCRRNRWQCDKSAPCWNCQSQNTACSLVAASSGSGLGADATGHVSVHASWLAATATIGTSFPQDNTRHTQSAYGRGSVNDPHLGAARQRLEQEGLGLPRGGHPVFPVASQGGQSSVYYYPTAGVDQLSLSTIQTVCRDYGLNTDSPADAYQDARRVSTRSDRSWCTFMYPGLPRGGAMTHMFQDGYGSLYYDTTGIDRLRVSDFAHIAKVAATMSSQAPSVAVPQIQYQGYSSSGYHG